MFLLLRKMSEVCTVPDAGIALMKHTAWRTLDRGGQFVLLGSAPDPKIQVRLTAISDIWPPCKGSSLWQLPHRKC